MSYPSTKAFYQIFDSVNLRHLLGHVFQSESKQVESGAPDEVLTNRKSGCAGGGIISHTLSFLACVNFNFLFSRTGAMNLLPPGQWSCLLLLFPYRNIIDLLCVYAFLSFFFQCLSACLPFFIHASFCIPHWLHCYISLIDYLIFFLYEILINSFTTHCSGTSPLWWRAPLTVISLSMSRRTPTNTSLDDHYKKCVYMD